MCPSRFVAPETKSEDVLTKATNRPSGVMLGNSELPLKIAGKTGCKVLGQTYNPRMARGKGRFSIDRIPYVIEQALPILKDFKHIVLVEANDPVAFFAYPNKPSMLKPQGCEVHRMTSGAEHSVAALEGLAGALHAQPSDRQPQKLVEIAKPTGALTDASIAQA